MKLKEKSLTLAASRMKARKYCEDNNLTIRSDETAAELRTIKGKVKCDFGFIHHPAIIVKTVGNLKAVVASTCDCYEKNEENRICSHCEAIVYKTYGEQSVPVVRDNSLSLYDEQEKNNTSSFTLDVKSIDKAENGTYEVKGRVKARFGFIHYPNIIIDNHVMTAYSCDCYKAAETVDACEHCQALYAKTISSMPAEKVQKDEPVVNDIAVEGAENVIDFNVLEEEVSEITEVCTESEVPASQFFEQHEPTSMKVLFGNDEATGEPVFWYPNDTSKLFHTNTGIIGTMGTGKTQFTKSLIKQLYDEQPNNYTGRSLGLLIFDYKGDYNESKPEFSEAVNAKIYKPYKLPFNPFALDGNKFKPRLPLHVASTFTDIVTKIYRLGPKQSSRLLHSIVEAYKACGIDPGDTETWKLDPPTFKNVYDVYMEGLGSSDMDSLYVAMTKLAEFELFEGDASQTVSLYNMLEGVCVVDLSGYDPSIQNLIVAIMLELFYSQMHNAGSSEISGPYRCLKKFILVDEADNFMSQNFPAIKKILKEGREFGVGVILSTQFLRHFNAKDEDYSKYILTWVVHNVADLKNSDVEFVFNKDKKSVSCEEYFHKIKALECHRSLAKIANDDPIQLKDKPFFELMSERNN